MIGIHIPDRIRLCLLGIAVHDIQYPLHRLIKYALIQCPVFDCLHDQLIVLAS